MAMLMSGTKTLELTYAYNEFELKIKVKIPEDKTIGEIADSYGDCYVTNKHIYVKYADKYVRVPFKRVTYIKREPMDHDIVYDDALNLSENHLHFYETVLLKYGQSKRIVFDYVAYQIKFD